VESTGDLAEERQVDSSVKNGTPGRAGRSTDIDPGNVDTQRWARRREGVPTFLGGQHGAIALRRNPDAEVAARTAFDAVVRWNLLVLATRVGVARLRGSGKIGDEAGLAAVAAAVRGDGYPNAPEEVEEGHYQIDMSCHGRLNNSL
jgi:hypothetical protein